MQKCATGLMHAHCPKSYNFQNHMKATNIHNAKFQCKLQYSHSLHTVISYICMNHPMLNNISDTLHIKIAQTQWLKIDDIVSTILTYTSV